MRTWRRDSRTCRSAMSAAASAAFARALEQSPGHPKASVGEYAIATRSGDQPAIDRARVDRDSGDRRIDSRRAPRRSRAGDRRQADRRRPDRRGHGHARSAADHRARRARPDGSSRSIRCWPRFAKTRRNRRFSRSWRSAPHNSHLSSSFAQDFRSSGAQASVHASGGHMAIRRSSDSSVFMVWPLLLALTHRANAAQSAHVLPISHGSRVRLTARSRSSIATVPCAKASSRRPRRTM